MKNNKEKMLLILEQENDRMEMLLENIEKGILSIAHLKEHIKMNRVMNKVMKKIINK